LHIHDETGGHKLFAWPDDEALVRRVKDAVAAQFEASAGRTPTPLPIFFERRTHGPDLKDRLRRALRQLIAAAQVTLVPLSRAEYRSRPALTLPMEVAVLGDVDEKVLAPLQSQTFLATPGTHGLRIERINKVGTLSYRMSAAGVAIAVADATTALKVLRDGTSRTWPPRHPRLLFAIGSKTELKRLASRALPAATSLVLGPFAAKPERAGQVLAQLTLGLIHDQPLHASLASAIATGAPPRARAPWMLADPSSNWNLSIGDAYDRVRERAYRIVQAAWALPPRSTFKPEAADMALLERVTSLRPDFTHETSGLEPTYRAFAEIGRRDARVLDAVEQAYAAGLVEQERKVAINLHRTRSATLSVDRNFIDPRLVLPSTTLGLGYRYKLHVGIGAPLPANLIGDDEPSIDAALEADPQGHLLDVTVFGLDFTVEGPPVVQVKLPLVGPAEGSGPGTFACRHWLPRPRPALVRHEREHHLRGGGGVPRDRA
jgi:hypothetical protein